MRALPLLFFAAACSPADEPDVTDAATDASDAAAAGRGAAPWFVDEAAERGLVFMHASGAEGELLLPEIMGGGAALADVDADGDVDAFLVQGGGVRREDRPKNALFLNNGGGRFASAPFDVESRGYGMGVAVGDVDGDGLCELYVTNVGENALLANLGGGRFQDVTTPDALTGWSTSAAFLDVELDGDLDLYVARYIVWDPDQELACANDMGARDYCSPTAYGAPAVHALLENTGGALRDVTQRSGVGAAAANGLGVVCGDFDRDGWTDIFVANDQNPNLLWRNQGDGTFVDDAVRTGCALDQSGQAKAGMGVAVADIDADGDEDLLVCNLNRESDSYYENRGEYFVDRTAAVGLAHASRAYTRFGLLWADFDHDGRLDLYEANGRVLRRTPRYAEDDDYAEPNLVLRGVAGARLEEVLPRGGTEKLLCATSRAAASGDVDGDGALDVLVANRGAPAYLLMNRVQNRGHWVGLRVVAESGADALHAVVELTAGGRTQRREVRAASSYLASSSPLLHFGVGASERVDTVRVRWPDGVERTFGPLAVDAVHRLERP